MSDLSPRALEIYDFIRRKIEDFGFPPTIRDIGSRFEIKSPNGVMCHLKALEKKGLVRRVGGGTRSIVKFDPDQSQNPQGSRQGQNQHSAQSPLVQRLQQELLEAQEQIAKLSRENRDRQIRQETWEIPPPCSCGGLSYTVFCSRCGNQLM